MRGNRLVVLVAQKSAEIDLAGPNDIFKVGTVARIARMIRMPDGTMQIIVQGLERVDSSRRDRLEAASQSPRCKPSARTTAVVARR